MKIIKYMLSKGFELIIVLASCSSLIGCATFGVNLAEQKRDSIFETSKTDTGSPTKVSENSKPLFEKQRDSNESQGPKLGSGFTNTAEYHFSLAQSYVAEGNSDRAIEEYKIVLEYDPNSALVYTRIAVEYVKKGALSMALANIKEALHRDPKFTDALMILGGLYTASKETSSALEQYEKVLKIQPTNEEAMTYKSQLLLEDGRESQSVEFLTQYLKKSPDSEYGWYFLGRSYQAGKKWKLAESAYKRAVEIESRFLQAVIALGGLYEEQEKNKEAMASYIDAFQSTQSASLANKIATLYIKQDKYKESMPYLEMVVNTDPSDFNARIKLGLIQMELKEFNRAIETFQQILQKFPDSDRVNFYLGSLYMDLKNPEKALELFKKVQVESNFYGDSVLQVANAYRAQKQTNLAKTSLDAAILKVKRVPQLYVLRATLEEEEKNYDKGVLVLEEAIRNLPDDERLRYYLGTLYDKLGKTDQGIEQMEVVLKLNPKNAEAMNYIGYTWTTKGVRLSDAEKLLKKAIHLRPKDPYIQDSWGWYLYVTGQFKQSVRELEKAVAMKPQESTILEHLGDVYSVLNLKEKAATKYEEALQYASTDSDRKKYQDKLDGILAQVAQENDRPEPKRGPATNKE